MLYSLLFYFLLVILATHVLHFFFFFNDTATTEIYTLSLHDALPISLKQCAKQASWWNICGKHHQSLAADRARRLELRRRRSEEHTSELQSRQYLVCRLLLEKKNKTKIS